jgi:hypothetical protein
MFLAIVSFCVSHALGMLSMFYFCSGWISVFRVVGSNIGAGIVMILAAPAFSLHAAVSIILLIRVSSLRSCDVLSPSAWL